MPLPIDALLPEIRRAVADRGRLVLQAEPGAGKTTRVPPALLGDVTGTIVVAQPRRLAARMAAARVASELGEEPGGVVGYEVRFDRRVGPGTRLVFVTLGVLARRLREDRTLRGVSVVVLDEFHERQLDGDLCLALLRDAREDLKLVVMSATLDAKEVAAYLGDCPVVSSPGRAHPVNVVHATEADRRPLAAQVATAAYAATAQGTDGDVLVFLPGAGEIRRAGESCQELAKKRELDIVTLHGDLGPREQDRAVMPGKRRKIILSTNVAETSVTIEGVRHVIDSGLVKRASWSPFTGLSRLEVRPVSQASAIQRAGRAGRTAPGHCLRLYTQHDMDTRPAFDAPEVTRADMSEVVLMLASLGIAELDWLTPPETDNLARARDLLGRLGALSGDEITELGHRMLTLPVHPRLAAVVLAGARRGVADDACTAAALLSERDVISRGVGPPRRASVTGPSDILHELDLLHARDRSLAGAAVKNVQRVAGQLRRHVPGDGLPPDDRELALSQALLVGFSDRVGRRRRHRESTFLLSAGGTAEAAPESIVTEEDLVVVAVAEERRHGGPRHVIARKLTAIREEWLWDLFPDRLGETRELTWDTERQRVQVTERVLYDELVLHESSAAPGPEDGPAAATLLAERATAAGIERFVNAENLRRVRGRLALAHEHAPEAGFHVSNNETLLVRVCQATGATSFAELASAGIEHQLMATLSPQQRGLLDKLVPERVRLAAGRQVTVQYEENARPFIASRMQDFFGMTASPTICGGKLPLVMHLLAPNRRAVQVTDDLSGFWQRHYPALRRQLSRRYPRHAWPEAPV